MTRFRWWLVAGALALVLATSLPVRAQLIGGQRQDQDQPIQIDAKTLEVHDREKIATFSGNVKVVQGDTTMTCKTLVVFYGQDPGSATIKPVVNANNTTGSIPTAQNIRRIEARGAVTVVSKDQNA